MWLTARRCFSLLQFLLHLSAPVLFHIAGSVEGDEGITDESFLLLDLETINTIFKKSGPKLIFKEKFKEHKRKQADSSMSDSVLAASFAISPSSTETACSSQSTNDSCFELEEVVVLNEINNLENIFKTPLPPPCKGKRTRKTIDNDVETPNKKSPESSLFAHGLENLLNSHSDGRLALFHKHKLNNDLRNKVAKVIVNELLSQCGHTQIRSDIFKQAAEEITNLFPGEHRETYYIPYHSNKLGLRQPARGKLWARYINVKAAFRVAKASEIYTDEKENGEDPEPQNEHLEFLHTAIEPFHRILQAWEATFNLRNNLYNNKTIEDIFNDFPCLKQTFGIDLMESDFNQAFPEKIDIIYNQWPKVSTAVLEEIKERNVSIEFGVETDISTRALLSLPSLFSPVTLRRASKGQNSWRPTRSEIQESFVFHLNDFSLLSEQLEARKRKLEKHNIPLQPFGVAVGEAHQIDSFYIYVNGNIYRCDTAIRCLELLYKIFHALNLQYPAECKHVWLFVQELIFSMPTTSKNSSTACVIADIKHHLNKK